MYVMKIAAILDVTQYSLADGYQNHLRRLVSDPEMGGQEGT
jgi:hypothetical protein